MKRPRVISSLRAMPPVVYPSNFIFSLENLFYLSWRCPLFWALFFLLYFLFFIIKVQLSRLRLWTSLIYNQLYYLYITFRGFLDVGRPPFFKFYEWMNGLMFFIHLSLCLNTSKALCMNFIYIVHIISMAMWFVDLGNHFTSSWVYGWISSYITKIQ